jgi:hypothetical protein
MAIFFPDTLYEPFYTGVLKNSLNESLDIPLKFKFDSRHRLSILVPYTNDLDIGKNLQGSIRYSIVHEGKALGSEVIEYASYGFWNLEKDSEITLFYFDLPYAGHSENLILRIDVLKPFAKFAELNELTCQVSSAYRL